VTLQSRGVLDADADERRRAIYELAPWFHNLHLPDGVWTAPDHPLGDFPAFKWQQLADVVPADLDGADVLDIGCNAGYYSFQLAGRGARVLAIDSDEHYLRQARWAAQWLDPDKRIEFTRMQIYELADLGRQFDLVLFLGVLYHLRYPQLALDLVVRCARGRMILQTLTMPGATPLDVSEDLTIDERERLTEPGWPRAAFIEHSLAGDPTNWWAFDDACVQAMVRAAGMRVSATPGHEIYICDRDGEQPEVAAAREAELQAALRRE
jgi:tRNA (mo5U34)-methyltransferase